MPTLRLFVASAVIVLAACRCTAVSAPTAATDQARAVYIRDAAALATSHRSLAGDPP